MLCSLPTTPDNPYDPFDQFDDWLKYDIERGYGTSEMLARLAAISDDYTEEQNQKIMNDAVEVMTNSKLFDKWVKVTKEIEVSTVN
jgi:hypothetical protein